MKYTIIGPGFLGKFLHSKIPDSKLIGKNDLDSIKNYGHDIIIVVAPTGNRLWVARDPDSDWSNCRAIIDTLTKCQYKQLIHVSTVDVYSDRTSSSSLPGIDKPSASYGCNRWLLEKALKQLPNSHTVRLPSISDPLIQKNILYDLKNQQWLNSINLDSEIQWYVLNNLSNDIQNVINSNIDYINLVSAPIRNYDIVKKFTPELLTQLTANQSNQVRYDIHVAPGQYYVSTVDIWKSFEKFFVDTSDK